MQVKTIEGNSADRVQYVQYALTDKGIAGYGKLPENPNMPKAEDIIITSSAENGVTVTVNAPSDAFDVPAEELSLSVETVSNEAMQAIVEKEAASADENSTLRKTVLFDIKVMHNGTEVQPKKTVSMSFSGIKTPNADAQVFHIDKNADTAQDMQAETDGNGDISIKTDGFSPYGVTYTVDFHNGDVVFSLPGQGDVLLSELFLHLQINRSVTDVDTVVFSDENLLKVEKLADDWKLTSLRTFDTEQTLTITFNDGEVYVIRVTDPAKTPEGIYILTNPTDKIAVVDDNYGS